MTPRLAWLPVLLVSAIGLAACGGSEDSTSETAATVASDPAGAAGVRVVSPQEAAGTIADEPEELVILDVRTQEEFDEGRVEGAVMLDFYRDDFAEELSALDRDVPYVLYCRSGNRSGQARALMADLGFSDVEDVDGGIVAWQDAGLPVVTD